MHLGFDSVCKPEDFTYCPPEEQTLVTMRMAKLILDHGFTSCFSGGGTQLRQDVVARNEIDSGRAPGPRIRATPPEITVTGGMGDQRTCYLELPSFATPVDGPDEMVLYVRKCCREGVDNIKLNVSGDPFTPNTPAESTPMRQVELDAAVETAHNMGRKVVVHARSAEAIKRSLRAGVDVLYHCEFADEEALDMMEAAKDRIWVAPTIGLLHASIFDAADFIPEAFVQTFVPLLEGSTRTFTELRKRGVKLVIGGDYGFGWSPHGKNARDLEFFIDYFGFTAVGALRCATQVGGDLMQGGAIDKLGLVEEGYLADLLLVDGNPLDDVSILQDPQRLTVIMKDGQLHKHL